MAEYSENYTTNTTSYTFGTEVYKYSRTVDVINPTELDNSCIYCGAENGSKYDYYPTYMLDSAGKQLMNSQWTASGGNFEFTSNAKDMPFNICFGQPADTGNTNEAGENTVYQIGKTMYSKASAVTTSTIRVLNPLDIRKIIFYVQFDGYDGSSMSLHSNVDIKYLMDNSDTFFVSTMRITANCWNGTTFSNDSTIGKIRPFIVGKDFFLPINNSFNAHVFDMTDYNSRKDFTQSFYGAYDENNMAMSILPILSNEKETYSDGSGGVITANGNKYNYSYNYYNSNYNLRAPAKQVLKLLAYCGCYFMDSNYSLSGKNLNTMWNDEHIYLGEMKAGARTTGNFIKGTDLLTSDTINKGQYSSQTDFDPTPSPTPSGDDAEAETFGWGGNEVGGMVRYYLLSQSEMESLVGFMSNSNWTIDYRNCIVSMFIIPNNGTVVFDDDTFEPTTVKFRLDENNKVDTGISCNRIHNVVNNYGTIEIPRMNNNFLDYEPYSKYMVYVPFCGVTSLPDYIAGKEITVSIYPDVPTCSCTAVISSEDRKIATLRGNFGSSIPVTSDGSGLKTAAVINSMANGLVGLGEMVAGAGLDNPGLVIGGGMTAISSILQTALTFGQAFGYSVGSSGDTSFFGIGNRCEYYIAYPQWNNPDGEDTNIYGHTYGFVVNKRGIIGDFDGFTVCDNPHVTGFSCTSDEKDEIERLLREGIIIHKPSE